MKQQLHFDGLAIGPVPRVVGTLSDPGALGPDRWPDPAGFDIAELRMDLLGCDHPHALAAAQRLRDAGRPVLCTLRWAREGGAWKQDEAARLQAYRALLPHVSAIDVELHSDLVSVLVAEAHGLGRPVVGSFHDFQGTPTHEVLRGVIARGVAMGVDVVKIAARTETQEELDRLRALLVPNDRPLLSLLGMGNFGPVSRVLLAREGSCLTYGYADMSNAPGQVASSELMAAFRGGSSPSR